jgi:uncharacterized protein (UPF0335 family)
MPKKAVPKSKEPIGDNVLGTVGSYVIRIERLEEEKKDLTQDIKDVYAEAKSHRLEPKGIRGLVARRKVDKDKQAELDQLVNLYEEAMAKSQGVKGNDNQHKWDGPQ